MNRWTKVRKDVQNTNLGGFDMNQVIGQLNKSEIGIHEDQTLYAKEIFRIFERKLKMKNLSILFLLLIFLDFPSTVDGQGIALRDVYENFEVGQKQVIRKTLNQSWQISDTVEVHEFLGWMDTVSTPGQWIGEWSITPCKHYQRHFSNGSQDMLYYKVGNAVTEVRMIQNIDSTYQGIMHSVLYDPWYCDSLLTFNLPLEETNDPNFCNRSSTYLEGLIQYACDFGAGVNTDDRYLKSKLVVGMGEVMRLDSIEDDLGTLGTYYSEHWDQLIFRDGQEECTLPGLEYRDDIAEEGMSFQEIYNFEVGDEFIYGVGSGSHNGMGGWYSCSGYEYIIITGKQESANQYTYTYNQHRWGTCGNSGSGQVSGYDEWNMDLSVTHDKVGFCDPAVYPLNFAPLVVHYDTLCDRPRWDWSWDYTNSSGMFSSNSEGYGIGLGKIVDHHSEMNYSTSKNLIDFRKNGVACGDWIDMSVEEPNWESKWSIQPTIVDDRVTVVGVENIEQLEIRLMDASGRWVEYPYHKTLQGSEDLQLAVSNLKDGLYFIALFQNGTPLGSRRMIKL